MAVMDEHIESWRRWLAEEGRPETTAAKLRRLVRLAEVRPALDLEADMAAAYLHCGRDPYPDNRDWDEFLALVQVRLRPEVRTVVETLLAIRAREQEDDYDSISGPLDDTTLLQDLPAVPGFDVAEFCRAALLWSDRLADFCLRHARPSQVEYCQPHIASGPHGRRLALGPLPLGRFPESPDDFLAELEDMDLSGLPVQTLSEHMGRCVNLRRLRFENMDIRSLPEELLGLAHLETVVFWGCSGPHVPELVWRLPHLVKLEMESNLFERDLPDLSAEEFQALRDYGFSCKGLRELGYDLGNLDNLETLHLHTADGTRMPDQIGLLPRLRHLQILGPVNERGLTDALTILSSLRELDILDWRGPALAQVLFRMRQLERLSVHCAEPIPSAEIERLKKSLPDTAVSIR